MSTSWRPWLALVYAFYNGLDKTLKMSIDAAAGNALMEKLIEVAKTLLEDMASNNYHWLSERATMKRNIRKYYIDTVDMLAIKVDALT